MNDVICGNNSYKEFDNEIELISFIRKYANIYIYGAGQIGKMVQSRLIHHGIIPRGFVVSNSDGKTNDDIFVLDQLSKDQQMLLLVSVTSLYRDEIIGNLRAKGIFQYVVITDKLIKTMDRLKNRKLHFQTHLVEHCNLKCRGCYHFSSLAKEEFLDLSEYKRDIQRLSELFNGEAEEILLLGGEPLLHPEIISFIESSRKYFPIGEIKILTNGLLLLDMSDSFYDALRNSEVQLWVTKYPVNFDYEYAEQYALERGVRIQYFAGGEKFRSLGHEPLDLNGRRDFKKNFYHCYRANECVDLKHGKMYPCIIPAEISPFREYFNVKLPVTDADSIDIYAVSDADELLIRLEQPIPFCRFCNRDDIQVFGRIPWGLTKFDIKEWTE